MRSNERRERAAEEAALRLVQEHAAELLRFARRFSHCADDAHDAYQRTLEILVRRLRSDPPAQPLSWTRTVLRNEALRIRTEREQFVSRVEVDLDRHEDRHVEDPAEHALGHERVRHTAEALRHLKPQEITALVLRAEGLTYREISSRMNWTYTKTNRCVTEGRRALRERLGAIESGAECARWLPLLSALADGEASAAQLAELRPHLRSCPGCRATLREFHAAPGQVAALVPPALVALAPAAGGSLAGHAEVALHGVVERLTLAAARVQGALEALSGPKLAAVAASTAALAGGGAALQHASGGQPGPSRAPTAQVAAAPATGMRLLTISAPLPEQRAPSSARRPRRAPSSSEFGAEPTASPEFASRTTSPPEFASAPVAKTAAAAASSSPAPPTSPPGPSEFGGP